MEDEKSIRPASYIASAIMCLALPASLAAVGASCRWLCEKGRLFAINYTNF